MSPSLTRLTPILLIGALTVVCGRVEAQEWGAAAAGGGELNFAPAPTGHGWVFVDVSGKGVAGSANLRLVYNTTKLHVGVERLSFANDKLAFFTFVEAEALLSQLLVDYFERGRRLTERGFNASYVLFNAKLQWYPGKNQTLELVLYGRHWWFATTPSTSGYVLPPNTWVFEPRIGYVFWKVDSPSEEWEAHRIFPRIRGVALGIRGGVDVRSRVQPWGIPDGRNDPGRVIYTVRQWLRTGWQFVPLARLQLEQWASYGYAEDDITRNRIGGVNPYVIPVPGLPWTGLICERLIAGLLGFHIKPSESSRHEFGVLVGGGAFNDVTRNGALSTFGGTGGLSLFGDFRFGERDRYQLNARASWGFPVVWLSDGPYLSALLSFGARIF